MQTMMACGLSCVCVCVSFVSLILVVRSDAAAAAAAVAHKSSRAQLACAQPDFITCARGGGGNDLFLLLLLLCTAQCADPGTARERVQSS